MATDSIFHMVRIENPKTAEAFLYALEAAEQWAMEHKEDESSAPSYREMTDEEIDRLFTPQKTVDKPRKLC